MTNKAIQIISIDGNIGAGKTTLINEYYKKHVGHCIIKTEPINEWKELLSKAAKEPSKYVYELQCLILRHFEKLSKEIKQIKNNKLHLNTIMIVERSAMSSIYIFAKIYLNHKIITQQQFNTLNSSYEKIKINYDKRILINTNPGVCLQRIKKRNRKCEETIKLSYLQNIHKFQQQMYSKIKCATCVINGNESFDNVYESFINNL